MCNGTGFLSVIDLTRYKEGRSMTAMTGFMNHSSHVRIGNSLDHPKSFDDFSNACLQALNGESTTINMLVGKSKTYLRKTSGGERIKAIEFLKMMRSLESDLSNIQGKKERIEIINKSFKSFK